MASTFLEGYGGIRLAADIHGAPDDPAVLLIPGSGQTREIWRDVAIALARSGRRVISLDLRGHGESERPLDGRYDLDAYVGDLRCILSRLDDRPVVVAASLGGWIASACLGEDGQHLATGLVLIDAALRPGPSKMQVSAARCSGGAAAAEDAIEPVLTSGDLAAVEKRLIAAGSGFSVPVMIVRGAESPPWDADAAAKLGKAMADAEIVEFAGLGHRIAADESDALNAVLVDFLERKVPRTPPEFRAGSDARTLRDALGCFGTGVTVVTTIDAAGRPIGLTANSFTSVSLDPPLLLVCIARNAGSAPAFEAASDFAVNVLHIGQQPISARFARREEDRFAATPWEAWDTGAPIIKESLASFECAREAVHDGGDHLILVGRVLRVRFEPRRDPLFFFRGKYRRLHFA